MKRPNFLHGVVAALVLAGFASIAYAGLSRVAGDALALRVIVAGLGFGYVGYLFAHATGRTGRVTALALYCAVAVASVWLAPSLTMSVLLNAAALSVIRSLYFYSGIVPALLDFALSALGAAAAAWAISQSGGVFLATWCFFLVQALFAAIPAAVSRASAKTYAVVPDDSEFRLAQRRAEAALHQLFNQTHYK